MIWYRVGKKLKRSIYCCTEVSPEGFFIGVMDEPEMAKKICDLLNLEENGTTKVPVVVPGCGCVKK